MCLNYILEAVPTRMLFLWGSLLAERVWRNLSCSRQESGGSCGQFTQLRLIQKEAASSCYPQQLRSRITNVGACIFHGSRSITYTSIQDANPGMQDMGYGFCTGRMSKSHRGRHIVVRWNSKDVFWLHSLRVDWPRGDVNAVPTGLFGCRKLTFIPHLSTHGALFPVNGDNLWKSYVFYLPRCRQLTVCTCT